MTEKSFEVPNIGCEACVKAIESELGDIPGVARVSGDAASRRVQVNFAAPATWEEIVKALQEIDYPPAAGEAS